MLEKILSFEYESTSDNSMPKEKLYIEILIFLKLGYAQKKPQPPSRSVKLQHRKIYHSYQNYCYLLNSRQFIFVEGEIPRKLVVKEK